MEITLKRIARKAKYTIGRVYVDGKYHCDCIEDKDRGLKQTMTLAEIKKIKVPSETAIPAGRYRVRLDRKSPKFSKKEYYMSFCKGMVPYLDKVPGYDGILIHRGINQNSSAGCIIVGFNTIVGQVTDSRKAFESLCRLMWAAADRGEEVWITIQ